MLAKWLSCSGESRGGYVSGIVNGVNALDDVFSLKNFVVEMAQFGQ